MPDVCIWNRCNNNCIMCTNPIGFRNKSVSFLYSEEMVISRIKYLKRNKKIDNENINLTGGEPTIHPDFLQLLRQIREIFPENKIVMASNGRMFNYPWFAKECLKINNFTLVIAINGFNSQLHDSITMVKGSFEQTVSGIHNILKYKNHSQEMEIRIIITKLTYKHIDKIINFVKREFSGINRIVLIFMEMEGYAKKNFNIVGLTYQKLKPYLTLPQIKKWEKGLPEIRLYHFPLCVLEPDLWPYTWRTLGEEEVTFLPRCDKCLYKKYCLGIHKDYLKLVGDKEFQPIRKKMDLQVQDFFHHPIVKFSKLSKRRQ